MTAKNKTGKEINKMELCSISESKKLPTDQKVLVKGTVSRMRVVNIGNSNRFKAIVMNLKDGRSTIEAFFAPRYYRKVIASIQNGRDIYLFGRLNNTDRTFNIESKGVLEDFICSS